MIQLDGVVASYGTSHGRVTAVDGITISLSSNAIVGIAGESGSGKTTLMRVIYGDVTSPLSVDRGRILYGFKSESGVEVTTDNIKSEWFKSISYIPQSSMSSLNPVRRVKHQFMDFLQVRGSSARRTIMGAARDFLSKLDLSGEVLEAYPHQLSGGMRQRVMIALAFFLRPKLIIADEPTSALDVVVQKGILKMLIAMQREVGNTVIFVSHDMAVHYQVADQIAIMYAGKIVEFAKTDELFARSHHPYTRSLIDALPRVGDRGIRSGAQGKRPSLTDMPVGCRFASRCIRADKECASSEPPLVEVRTDHFCACHHPYRG